MSERLTVKGAVSQKDIDYLIELSNENQFGRNDAYYKLQKYEDLEEQLESVYGECEGLLQTVVKHLVDHGAELEGQTYKSVLLTDEDVDEWENYKKLKAQGLLVRLPYPIATTEAEIRNKAIDEFAKEALKQFADFDFKHGYPTVADCEDILGDVAGRLKGRWSRWLKNKT